MNIKTASGPTWFLASCIEFYKDEKNMSGQEVYDYFRQNKVVDFLVNCWEGLHTTSPQYVIDSIDEFVSNVKK